MNAEAAHLLVVDDDDRIRTLLKQFLCREGFRVSVAADACGARALLQGLAFDLVVLDVMMPGEDGLALTNALRADPDTTDTAIILLTARGEADARIAGLRAGADDYLPKPFEPEELLLRIRAVLKRAGTAPLIECVAFGACTYRLGAHELTRAGDSLHLTEAEAALLSTLASRPGDVVAREDLRGRGSAAHDRSIDVQVTRLRRKIEDDPRLPRFLQTVRGEGYRLLATPTAGGDSSR
ncbi:MAG: response regulator [Maricaulaceae bacterium]